MRFFFIATLASSAAAVKGAAEGFASGVTGGGSLAPVFPKTPAELISYLGDARPRVIHLDRTIDFTRTEGTVTATGCAPWGTSNPKCQLAINANGWCDNYQKTAPKLPVTYDKAGVSGIKVTSNKTLVGVGGKGVIKGKGLRMANGVSNIIVQNVHITNLNPKYVWGGDAITLDGTDMIWIDHVTTSLIGRQHIVLGNGPSGRVTISNSKIDGTTRWSASCDGYHYWALYFTGSSDTVTFKNNYIHHTSGRSPKVGGNTLLHAVNNYWYDNSGHAFEIQDNGMVLVEGSVFQNIKATVETPHAGQLFTSPDANTNAQCAKALGRSCVANVYGSSGVVTGKDTGFLSNFKGKHIAGAGGTTDAENVQVSAGFGTI